MAKIIGTQCFVSESRSEALFGSFNSVLSGAVMVVAEELLWAGSHRDSGVLKDMLTADTVTINAKYMQPWTEPSFLNAWILTNNAWAVQAGCSARRFFVLRPLDTYSGAQTLEAREHFARIVAVPPEAFAHLLYERDLSSLNSRQVPLTTALVDQKLQSLTPMEAVAFELLQREFVVANEPFDVPLPRGLVYAELSKEFGDIRNFPSAPQTFWSELRRVLTCRAGKCLLQDVQDGKRITLKMRRDRHVQLPPLATCRAWWCEHKFAEQWGAPKAPT